MITAIVFVKADVARIPEVAEQIAALEGVSEVYSVTGQIDLIALVRVRNHDDVATVVADRLNKVPGVTATETHIARVFIDDCLARHLRGELDAPTASMAKWWTTELLNRVVDRAVQLHGGYGYMAEYPVARAFVNARVHTIYGGTTEIQKEIIGRSLGL